MFKNNKLSCPFKKIFILLSLIFLILFASVTLIINSYLDKITKIDINTSDLYVNSNLFKNEALFFPADDIKNIALFGIDETDGNRGRSDCIIILTIDNKNKKIKLSSIIRDSYVIIPNRENKDKINHAYAFGGPALALQTLNFNFNLNITQFATVNFSSLPKIINDIGGITLDISNDELLYINSYINNLNKVNNTNSPNITTPGIQKVDGTQALAYCRIRYTSGGDFERSHRHRIVIEQMLKQVKDMPIEKYPCILDEVLPLVQTNLNTSDIFSLTLNLNNLKNQSILEERFPNDEDGNGKLISGIYYYVFDEESTTKKIHDFIYEK